MKSIVIFDKSHSTSLERQIKINQRVVKKNHDLQRGSKCDVAKLIFNKELFFSETLFLSKMVSRFFTRFEVLHTPVKLCTQVEKGHVYKLNGV